MSRKQWGMKYVYAIAILVAGELISLLLFTVIRKWFAPTESSSAGRASIAKGILERVTLFTGLLYGFPQILIAFGALKLGTRFSTEQQTKISNDYFLVGNLLSILLALVYTIIVKSLWNL